MAKADALEQFECLPNEVRKEGRKCGIVENIYISAPRYCQRHAFIHVIVKYKYV